MKVKFEVFQSDNYIGFKDDPFDDEAFKDENYIPSNWITISDYINYCISNYSTDNEFKLIDTNNRKDVIEKLQNYICSGPDTFHFYTELEFSKLLSVVKMFSKDNYEYSLEFGIEWVDNTLEFGLAI